MFSAEGDPKSATSPQAPVPVCPDLVLAVPGEYSGGTAFPGCMRPRVFTYDAMQGKPAIPADPIAFLSSYPWRIGITTTVFWVGEPASLKSPGRAAS